VPDFEIEEPKFNIDNGLNFQNKFMHQTFTNGSNQPPPLPSGKLSSKIQQKKSAKPANRVPRKGRLQVPSMSIN
jgi:hypothetical protein